MLVSSRLYQQKNKIGGKYEKNCDFHKFFVCPYEMKAKIYLDEVITK